MKTLLIFLLGFCFAVYLTPIIDELQAWLLTWIELRKRKLGIETQKINTKMAQEQEEDIIVRPIGFCAEDHEEKDGDDDDL